MNSPLCGAKSWQLLPQAVFPFAQRVDPPAYGGDMLTDIEVEPLHEGRIDLLAQRRQHLLDCHQCAEHHTVRHTYQAPLAYGFDHLHRAAAAAASSAASG